MSSMKSGDDPKDRMSGDDPKARESGDDPVLAMTWRKAVFEDPRKDSRAPKVLVCGPRF
jgi:hypothetical protein